MQRHTETTHPISPVLRFYRGRLLARLAIGMALLACMAYAPLALAVPPAFTIIGPKEWDLPIAKPNHGISAFFQTAVYTFDTRNFDMQGNNVQATNKGRSFLGLTRFAHVFSFKSLPGVGFFWEYLQPEVRVTKNNGTGTVSGLGDPLIDGAVYTRPVKNLMVGVQNIVSVPVGNNDLTKNYWEDDPSIMTDYQMGRVGFDNTVGVGIKSTYHAKGVTANEGDDFYEDARLRYTLNHYLTPFISYDYARTYGGHYLKGKSGNIPSSYQDIAGAGTLIYLKSNHKEWLDLWYDVGFAGRNATRVNGIFSRFVYLF